MTSQLTTILCKEEKSVKFAYTVDGKFHRPSNEGSAVVVCSSDKIEDNDTEFVKLRVVSRIYYEHGKKHRPSNEGPAEMKFKSDNEFSYKCYYEHGKKHRPSSEGPAEVEYEFDCQIETYYNHGKIHRPLDEGPAIIVNHRYTGRVDEYYYVNGIRVTSNGDVIKEDSDDFGEDSDE